MSGLNWDVDPASIKTTPVTSERAQIAMLNYWSDQVADMQAELRTWELDSRKYDATLLALGKLSSDLYELRRERELNAPVEAVSAAERAHVLRAMAEYRRDLEARIGAD